jgi:translocation protein SEC63
MEHKGNSAMFGIFILSVYSLFLIPFTLYRVCSASDEAEAAQPWQAS